jgi:hypothetical protein
MPTKPKTSTNRMTFQCCLPRTKSATIDQLFPPQQVSTQPWTKWNSTLHLPPGRQNAIHQRPLTWLTPRHSRILDPPTIIQTLAQRHRAPQVPSYGPGTTRDGAQGRSHQASRLPIKLHKVVGPARHSTRKNTTEIHQTRIDSLRRTRLRRPIPPSLMGGQDQGHSPLRLENIPNPIPQRQWNHLARIQRPYPRDPTRRAGNISSLSHLFH